MMMMMRLGEYLRASGTSPRGRALRGEGGVRGGGWEWVGCRGKGGEGGWEGAAMVLRVTSETCRIVKDGCTIG